MYVCPLCGETIFTKSELRNAADAMFKVQRKPTWNSVKELYDDLCYFLGPHYWGYEYSWEEDA